MTNTNDNHVIRKKLEKAEVLLTEVLALAERKQGPVGMALMMEVAQIREQVRQSLERVK